PYVYACLCPTLSISVFFFFINATATTEIYTLSYTTLFRSQHRSPTKPRGRSSREPTCSTVSSGRRSQRARTWSSTLPPASTHGRSEEHTSELQSRSDLVCRLLLEKKKKKKNTKEKEARRR